MIRFSHAFGLSLALLSSACGGPPAPSSQSANTVSPGERLSRIVDGYWDGRPPGRSLTAQSLADALANERGALDAAAAIPRAGLDAGTRLTYDIFMRRRQTSVEGYTYPAELIPVEPFESLPLELAREAAKAAEGQLAAPKDYESWLRRMDDGVLWMRQAVTNMREGLRRGYTVPKVLIERMLPLLAQLGEDSPTNVFYAASHDIPDTIREPDRSVLAARITSAAKEHVLPAYREMHAFLKGEYLAKARTSVALSALPLGASWYAARVAHAVGGRASPDALHAEGTAEVERLRARLAALAPPGLPAVGSDPIVAAEELKSRVLAAAPTLFAALPREDFQIRAFTPRYAEPSMIYAPAAPPARRTAVLFVAAGSTESRVQPLEVAQFLEAAAPGRHLQSALQEERTDLPRFRRFESDPAFVQGWALYAASLGEELGVYADDEARRDALQRQLRCAVALVVDTGIHAGKWSRDQAAEYLKTQASLEEMEAGSLTDRIIALPGDALSCTVGEIEFRTLRAAAQQTLGGRFDIREFHSEVLKEGSMPLDILDARIRAWMGSVR